MNIAEGQGQQSLHDALGEAGERLGEMILHAHLALSRVANTDSITRRMRAFVTSAGGRSPSLCLSGTTSSTPDEPEALTVLTAAMTGVGEEQAAGMRAGEGEDALALVLVGGPQVVAERRP